MFFIEKTIRTSTIFLSTFPSKAASVATTPDSTIFGLCIGVLCDVSSVLQSFLKNTLSLHCKQL